MMSINRQCEEVTRLLAAIQACVDRDGWMIPWCAADFDAYIAEARLMMGVR